METDGYTRERRLDFIRQNAEAFARSKNIPTEGITQKLLMQRMRQHGFMNPLTQRIGLALQLKLKQPQYQLTPEEILALDEKRKEAKKQQNIELAAYIGASVAVVFGIIGIIMYLILRQKYYISGTYRGKDNQDHYIDWQYSYSSDDSCKFKGDGEDSQGKFSFEGQSSTNPYNPAEGATITISKKYQNGQQHIFNGTYLAQQEIHRKKVSRFYNKMIYRFRGSWFEQSDPSQKYTFTMVFE